MADGEPLFVGVKEGVALALVERGFDVHLPLTARYFVHDQRLVERDDVDGASCWCVDHATPSPKPPRAASWCSTSSSIPASGSIPRRGTSYVGAGLGVVDRPPRSRLGATLAGPAARTEAVLWAEIVTRL